MLAFGTGSIARVEKHASAANRRACTCPAHQIVWRWQGRNSENLARLQLDRRTTKSRRSTTSKCRWRGRQEGGEAVGGWSRHQDRITERPEGKHWRGANLRRHGAWAARPGRIRKIGVMEEISHWTSISSPSLASKRIARARDTGGTAQSRLPPSDLV